MSECNGCGACCRVIRLDQSWDEVQQMAALTRVLGIPSDHQFVAEHWRPLSQAEAMERNPFYTSRLAPTAHLYTCDRLGADGLCTAHDQRPLVCRGYPWYDQPPRDVPLADPECSYAPDLPEGSAARHGLTLPATAPSIVGRLAGDGEEE